MPQMHFPQMPSIAWLRTVLTGFFVRIAGDTMTGPLRIYTNTTDPLVIAPSAGPSTTIGASAAIYIENGGVQSSGIQIEGVNGGNFQNTRYSNNPSATGLICRKARGGSIATPAVVLQNDSCMTNQGVAYDGVSAYREAALFQMNVIEPTPGPAAMGGEIKLFATQLGTITRVEVARFQVATGLSMFGANTVVDGNRGIRRRALTFGTLPAAAANPDAMYVITDGAAAPVWGAAAAGGGAVRTPVWSNGAAWLNG